MLNARCLSWSAALAGSVSIAAPARAADYTYSILVETGDTFAGHEINGLTSDPVVNLNDAGDFTFGHFDTNENRAYFRGSIDGGAQSLIYAEGIAFNGLPVGEANRMIRLSQSGSVAFTFDQIDGGSHSVVARDAAVLFKQGDTIDGETFDDPNSESVDINTFGRVAHFSALPEPSPLPPGYNFSGAHRLVINGDIVKRPEDGNGNQVNTLAGSFFYGFHQDAAVDLNDEGDYLVSFWKDGVGDDALAYVGTTGTEVLLAEKGATFAATGETITDVGRNFALNNSGGNAGPITDDTAYTLGLTNTTDNTERSVIILNGGVAVAEGDVIDGFTIDGLTHNFLQLTEGGALAFGFDFNDGDGQGIAIGGDVVAYTGMVIDGKAVQYVSTEGFGLNGLGQLAFGVEFVDGTSALVLANIPEPASLALLTLGGLLIARRRR